jgi:hypothetical protein
MAPFTKRAPAEEGGAVFPVGPHVRKKIEAVARNVAISQSETAASSWKMNSGQPGAGAFIIPPFGEEVLLGDVPAGIEEEQFWYVVEQWAREGEGILRSSPDSQP